MQIVAAHTGLTQAYIDYVAICQQQQLDYYDDIGDVGEFLQQLVDNAEGRNLPDGWVPCETYFCIDNQQIIGSIRWRKGTTPFIENIIGHIGYDTHPQRRGEGVAKALLNYVKTRLDVPVILCCDKSNIASQKVMSKCGAIELDPLAEQDATLLRFSLA